MPLILPTGTNSAWLAVMPKRVRKAVSFGWPWRRSADMARGRRGWAGVAPRVGMAGRGCTVSVAGTSCRRVDPPPRRSTCLQGAAMAAAHAKEPTMRYMMIVKTEELSAPPPPELFAAIGAMSQELAATGVLLENGGLLPSAHGARIRLEKGGLAITDGPFTESKELIGGFAIMQAGSKDEAVELGRRFMQVHADILGADAKMTLEIRAMVDPMHPGGCGEAAVRETTAGVAAGAQR
jgi:hypothetical protein